MPVYRLLLEYDGEAYHGWQTQPALQTVQGALDRALTLVTRQPISTVGAGRTDRGVHARGQVASFRAAAPVDCRRAVAGIHGICGAAIRVRRMEEAPESFHARHGAVWREYVYRITESPTAIHRHRAFTPRHLPGIGLLREVSRPLLGPHDFTSFANASPDKVDPLCLVHAADWKCWEAGLLFAVRADHFLYKMVRTMVGTLLREAGPEGDGARGVAAIIEAHNRGLAAAPVPAAGLSLERVGYTPAWPEEG